MKHPVLEARRKELKPIDRLNFLHSYYMQNSEYFKDAYEKKLKQTERPRSWDWNASALKGKMYAWRDAAKELKELIDLIEKNL